MNSRQWGELVRSANLQSVDDLRVLLLFHRHPEQEWRPFSVSTRLHLDSSAVHSMLERLVHSGFLRLDNGKYRYAPTTTALATTVDCLVEIDRKHPVSLIKAISAARA